MGQGRCEPEISGEDKPSDENLLIFRLFQKGLGSFPRKFRNFRINSMHSDELIQEDFSSKWGLIMKEK